MKNRNKVSPIKYFFSGGIGGICSICVGHPMDTIKIRLQTMPRPAAGEKHLYSGMVDVIQQTVAHEGIRGLYKGMSSVLSAAPLMYALSFGGYGLGKRLFLDFQPGEPIKPQQIYMAGSFSALFTTLLNTPTERIKCLLQMQRTTGEIRYTGPIDVLRKLYQRRGIRAVYRGYPATLLRDLPAHGTYFLMYETLKQRFTAQDGTMSLPAILLSGGTAGLSNWMVALPFDTLKTRLQTSRFGTYKHGVRSVFMDIMKNEGLSALYRGAIPIFIRAFPANASCFFGFEMAMSTIDFVESMIYGVSV